MKLTITIDVPELETAFKSFVGSEHGILSSAVRDEQWQRFWIHLQRYVEIKKS